MKNPIIENLVDAASYETLQKSNPTLLAALEETLSEGATAMQVERRMVKRYGRDSLIGLLIAGAAHHIEKQRAERPLAFICPTCDPRPFSVTPGQLADADGWIACDYCGDKCKLSD